MVVTTRLSTRTVSFAPPTLAEMQKLWASLPTKLTGMFVKFALVLRPVVEKEAPLTESLWSDYERTLITNGTSKAYGLPGLRIGWLVGQPEALETVSQIVRSARAGLSDPDRPLGSFLFLGPTGVGKTELARALAEALFDSEEAIVRIDMSEYMEKHAVSRPSSSSCRRALKTSGWAFSTSSKSTTA